MANPLLGQILGSVFSNAMRGRARPGPFGRTAGGSPGASPGASTGGGLGGGLGGVALGGLLGGLMRGGSRGVGRAGGKGGMLLMLLLPLAMQWVQRSGGIGAVLEKFKQKGYKQQAQSWVSTGENAPLEVDAIDSVVGREELSRISKQLGVPEDEVAQAFAEIMPEMTDQLSPEGNVPPEADEALEGGAQELQRALREVQPDTQLN